MSGFFGKLLEIGFIWRKFYPKVGGRKLNHGDFQNHHDLNTTII